VLPEGKGTAHFGKIRSKYRYMRLCNTGTEIFFLSGLSLGRLPNFVQFLALLVRDEMSG
jgi:hypothetical protein